jgi:hypothetical protein
VPRYFLHIDELGTDPDGTELPDLEAARRGCNAVRSRNACRADHSGGGSHPTEDLNNGRGRELTGCGSYARRAAAGAVELQRLAN